MADEYDPYYNKGAIEYFDAFVKRIISGRIRADPYRAEDGIIPDYVERRAYIAMRNNEIKSNYHKRRRCGKSLNEGRINEDRA